MRRFIWLAPLPALALAGCWGGVSRTVDSSPYDVRTALEGNASTLSFADQLPGASHFAEPTETGIVWHFTVNGEDYARYVISVADKVGGSRVSGKFEAVEGPANQAVPYLRDTARAVSEETLLASLEKRAIDVSALKRKLIVNTVSDPSKIVGMQRAVMDEAANAMQDVGGGSGSAGPHSYDRHGYDRTPAYDRERVTQYEAERRRADARGN
jgi:hypothetical protein